MKSILFVWLVILVPYAALAQRTVALKNLWARPQVHVLFQGYTLSFTIKDMNKALSLLAETGDLSYGDSSGLDTGKTYTIELYPGLEPEYRNTLQPLMQWGVGAFLLLAGHAVIENPKHKKLAEVTVNIETGTTDEAYILFYDPKGHKLLFSGRMSVDMYNKDLGID